MSSAPGRSNDHYNYDGPRCTLHGRGNDPITEYSKQHARHPAMDGRFFEVVREVNLTSIEIRFDPIESPGMNGLKLSGIETPLFR